MLICNLYFAKQNIVTIFAKLIKLYICTYYIMYGVYIVACIDAIYIIL